MVTAPELILHVYVPSFLPPSFGKEPEKKFLDVQKEEEHPKEKERKPRAIDKFMEVDENFLLRTFGRFGPIASVKIMWPRTEEERKRQRNCGFVAFMNRADGQAAKDEMQGVVVYDYELKIGWGKSVALTSEALPAPPPGHMAIRNKEVLTPSVPDIVVALPNDAQLRHRVEVERTLTDSQRDEFEDMLRALTLERSQIKEAMGFALDNADAAGEIVEVLAESLTLKETPIPTKVARLMLVSDVLHNSSAPVKNASAFRTKFETALPDVMESFNDLYRSITGRITAEALKERVLKVLQVWADWFLFSDAYLNGLRATFLRSGNSGVIPFHTLCGDAPEIEKKASSENGSDGFRLNEDGALTTGKAAATRELLGLPLAESERRCRHNGLSLCGGKEMMVARLLSLEEAEKERVYDKDAGIKYGQGEPHRTGRDDTVVNAPNTSRPGEAGEPVPSKKSKADPVLPASKWSREDDGSDSEDIKGGREVSTDHSNHHPDTILDEENRKKLRQIEIAVMQHRESLEEKGLWNREEIERKVASHRRHLHSEYGLSFSNDGANSIRSSGM
ncbi:hypothetical protein E2562_032069 [Oryza meyeriana var. granulata]|uniref:RRM domain-containing protein n=1 Tax=Oryza meyeriana var. granulata TaxID=110450 RepID=A0A6G1CK55_9ORYZ|nr:hypothetical protein E2562_032069 [Oryza meyeriana var. granulata]